jgi:hypothetical protein
MKGVFEQMGWKLSWRPKAERKVYCRNGPDRRILELETAKEILEEVFAATSEDIEDMIQLRLAEMESREQYSR